jgi:hypothetical protein
MVLITKYLPDFQRKQIIKDSEKLDREKRWNSLITLFCHILDTYTLLEGLICANSMFEFFSSLVLTS